METYATPEPDNSIDDAAIVFETRGPFLKWLRALGVSAAECFDGFVGEAEPSECEVTFEGVLRVDGLLRGNIRSDDGTLLMTEQGRIEANVNVRVALIDGVLNGNLRAGEYVVLDRHARVTGDIFTPSLTIRDGAVFDGRSFLIGKTQASVSGDISESQQEQDSFEISYAGY